MLVFNQFFGLLLWIHLLTFVQGVKGCTLQEFKESPLFDEYFNFSTLEQRYDTGQQVRVPCQVGFSGFFRLICTDQGWAGLGEKCSQKLCGHPGNIHFGDVELVKGSYYEFGSQVQYTCHEGFQMTSNTNTRTCLEGGWDGVPPECKSIPCPSLAVDNTVAVNGDLDQLTSGRILQFSCRFQSDVLIGPTQILCDENGIWDNNPPTCQGLHQCESPPSLENGDYYASTFLFNNNTRVEYQCQAKYIMQGGPYKTCINGEWTGEITCLKPCTVDTDLMQPNKIRFRYSSIDKVYVEHNEYASFACIRGATHDGVAGMRQRCNDGEMVLPRCA